MGNSAFQTQHTQACSQVFSLPITNLFFPWQLNSIPCFAQANFLRDLLSLLFLSCAISHIQSISKYCQLQLYEQIKNQATSHHPHTLTWSFLTWILAVASYVDFLLSLCSPPICSHRSSAQNLPESPSQRKSQSLTVSDRALHTCHSSISPWCPDLISLSPWLSSQCSHASLLASLLTHQALFSHSPLALAGHVMPPATAELAASLPAGVCSVSSTHGGLPWPHWMKQTTATSLSPSYSPLFLFITLTIM